MGDELQWLLKGGGGHIFVHQFFFAYFCVLWPISSLVPRNKANQLDLHNFHAPKEQCQMPYFMIISSQVQWFIVKITSALWLLACNTLLFVEMLFVFVHVHMCGLGDTSESLQIDEISNSTYVVCMHLTPSFITMMFESGITIQSVSCLY